MKCSIGKKNPFLPLHAVHEVTEAKTHMIDDVGLCNVKSFFVILKLSLFTNSVMRIPGIGTLI